MTKTIFTGKKVKEFAFDNIFALVATLNAKFSRFTENLLVGNCPGYARYRHS